MTTAKEPDGAKISLFHGFIDMMNWKWYSPEAMKQIGTRLDYYTAEDIKTGMEQLCAEFDGRSRPGIHTIFRKLDDVQRRRHDSEVAQGVRHVCPVCGNDGWFNWWVARIVDVVTNPETGERTERITDQIGGGEGRIMEYVGRCFCREGRRIAADQYSWPQDEAHARKAYQWYMSNVLGSGMSYEDMLLEVKRAAKAKAIASRVPDG